MPTIREIISQHQTEVAKGNLQPTRAADILTELSALIGNILDEIQKREVAYNKILLLALDVEKSANKAKIQAEVSQEYQDFRTAKNTYEVVKEMIRALKYLLRAFEEDFRQSAN